MNRAHKNLYHFLTALLIAMAMVTVSFTAFTAPAFAAADVDLSDNGIPVLSINIDDGTLLRNRIVGYMGRQLGLDFTPMYTPVDLVVNGQYRGSYTLAHQVRIGKSRVNIKELSRLTPMSRM